MANLFQFGAELKAGCCSIYSREMAEKKQFSGTEASEPETTPLPEVTLPADYAPYPKGDQMFAKCRACGRHAPLKYSLETYADNIHLCINCAPSHVTTYKGMVAYLVETKIVTADAIKCVLCGGADSPEHADGITFGALPNSPEMQKTTCGVECLKRLQKTLTKTIDPPTLHPVCGGCREMIPKGEEKRCSRCKVVYYCGVKCQKGHWPLHKHACVAPTG
ncbi:MAG: zinc finger MYND domain-containing protein [Patescibacteria group bacterium]|nr:zinc finger MYND domain-containing protein [Patescibacteria group bacterium]